MAARTPVGWEVLSRSSYHSSVSKSFTAAVPGSPWKWKYCDNSSVQADENCVINCTDYWLAFISLCSKTSVFLFSLSFQLIFLHAHNDFISIDCLKFLVDFSLLVHISCLNCSMQLVVIGTFFRGKFWNCNHIFTSSCLHILTFAVCWPLAVDSSCVPKHKHGLGHRKQ